MKAGAFHKSRWGTMARMCARALFRISLTAGRIAPKLDVWLGGHYLCVLHALRVERIAGALVRTPLACLDKH